MKNSEEFDGGLHKKGRKKSKKKGNREKRKKRGKNEKREKIVKREKEDKLSLSLLLLTNYIKKTK